MFLPSGRLACCRIGFASKYRRTGCNLRWRYRLNECRAGSALGATAACGTARAITTPRTIGVRNASGHRQAVWIVHEAVPFRRRFGGNPPRTAAGVGHTLAHAVLIDFDSSAAGYSVAVGCIGRIAVCANERAYQSGENE